MSVLVVGGGGREHALAWKLASSPRVAKLYAAPGNPGIARIASCVPIGATDTAALANFAVQRRVDITVVGPEGPLALGIVDEFNRLGLAVFGPTKRAAEIESSKAWAKGFMTRHGIPTAGYCVFGDPDAARAFIRQSGGPAVVKADGLAAGKGVIVAHTVEEAEKAIETVASLGAGGAIVIEDLLIGQEMSFFAVTDGETSVPLLSARDHKRAWDGDVGPNTGGMGAVAPAPEYDEDLETRIMSEIIDPAVKGLAREGRRYVGVLYAGLMLTSSGPKVLEFNARLGDPETQAILPMMESDLVDLMEAALERQGLGPGVVRWRPGASACVVLASRGYPDKPALGEEIHIDDAGIEADDVLLFHAGTKLVQDRLVTSGGRVLNVVATGRSMGEAADRAYRGIRHVKFQGMWCRTDIGKSCVPVAGVLDSLPPGGE
ncbi:MAG: phosphoribosylamine--glycine ligase [Firmicutes bacterium]|nr:phosphoribosylamine--glycine ligase [Bacillota bacterium]MDH7496454.1 phosphoribosylamine--glycine ligase [Bacillota bacterium]